MSRALFVGVVVGILVATIGSYTQMEDGIALVAGIIGAALVDLVFFRKK